MRISLYVRNHNSGPSCYYRAYQYVNNKRLDGCDIICHDLMNDMMFKVNMSVRTGIIRKITMALLYILMSLRMLAFVISDLISRPDVVFVSRSTVPRRTPLYIRPLLKKLYKKSRVIWDFDDNILYSGEISKYESELLIKNSDHIIVTNEYLKDTLPDTVHDKVSLLPTTDGDFSKINIKKSVENRCKSLKEQLRIVWVGTSANLENVKRIMPEIEEFAKQSDVPVMMTVVCNTPFIYNSKIDNLMVSSVKWSRKAAIKAISHAHVGIMPLLDNEFTRGKGGFKLIQYMAAGVPVIASPVGFNLEIVNDSFGILAEDDEYSTSLYKILNDTEKWAKMAFASYDAYNEGFLYNKQLDIIKDLIFSY